MQALLLLFFSMLELKLTPSASRSLHDTVLQKNGRLKFGKVKKVLTKFDFPLL